VGPKDTPHKCKVYLKAQKKELKKLPKLWEEYLSMQENRGESYSPLNQAEKGLSTLLKMLNHYLEGM
jgi:hypothetical protein